MALFQLYYTSIFIVFHFHYNRLVFEFACSGKLGNDVHYVFQIGDLNRCNVSAMSIVCCCGMLGPNWFSGCSTPAILS